MSSTTMSRNTFLGVIDHAIKQAQDDRRNAEDRLSPANEARVRKAVETVTACAVASFGDPNEPVSCQCPLTQARVDSEEPGAMAFAFAFDSRVITLADDLTIHSVFIEG